MMKEIFSTIILILGFSHLYAADVNSPIVSTVTWNQFDISASTESAGFPMLLWEKKLTKAITSSAISKDGTKIAIADETGYLTVYNANGGKLWEYHYKGELPKRTYEFKYDKADTAILDIKFSAGGRFIVCDLGVLTPRKYEEHIGGYKPYKKLCFDMEGKLLWQTSRLGNHSIGGDKYILIRDLQSEDNETPIDYYVLDATGQLVYTGKTIGHENNCQGFSEDLRYMFVDNKLIESQNWQPIWEFKEKDRGDIWGIRGNHILVTSGWKGDRVYEITSRKKILDIGESLVESLTGNYVAKIVWGHGEKKYVLRVFEVKTGNIVLKRQYDSRDIEWCSKLLLHTANDEKHLILGSEKGILFYELKSGKSWKLPVEIRNCSFFNYYSVSDNGDAILIGYDRSARLYKSF